MKTALHTLKDTGLSAAARIALDLTLKPYGRVLSLRLDTNAKTLLFSVLLHGETEPLDVTVADYGIVTKDERDYLTAQQISISREWLNAFAAKYCTGRNIPISKQLAAALRVIC